MSSLQNLTPADVLRAKANAWLDDNHGTVHIALVEDAIRHSDLAGDPFSDNPFRHMLIAVAVERGVSRYAAVDARRCFCPDDCSCHYPWRPNLCGCAGHDVAVQS